MDIYGRSMPELLSPKPAVVCVAGGSRGGDGLKRGGSRRDSETTDIPGAEHKAFVNGPQDMKLYSTVLQQLITVHLLSIENNYCGCWKAEHETRG